MITIGSVLSSFHVLLQKDQQSSKQYSAERVVCLFTMGFQHNRIILPFTQRQLPQICCFLLSHTNTAELIGFNCVCVSVFLCDVQRDRTANIIVF